MKIAQIVCSFPPYRGGMGNAAFEFGRLLKARGHEVTNFTSAEKKSSLASKEKNISGDVIRLKPILSLGNASILPQLFWRLNDFDAIIFHYPYFGTDWIFFIWKLFHPKKKLFIYYHMDVAFDSKLKKIFSLPSAVIRNSFFNMAKEIWCSSFDYVESGEIKKYFKNTKDKFREINFGADLSRFIFIPRTEKINQEKNILFVGGLDRAHYFKGVDVLIQAVAKLYQDNIKDWRLNIVGDGELRADYEKLVSKLGLKEKINFLGKLDDKALSGVYAQADIFILPSIAKNEAFGIVLVEAMASGAAVIASNLPGVRSVFKNGEQGFYAQPNNIDDLAEKIKILIQDNNLRIKMSHASRKLAEEKYDWEKIGDRLNSLMFGFPLSRE